MSSASTTPRSRLTIPLCQRIALFACRGPKEAFVLAITNELFRETMIDYNTMHTVFCRLFWQDNDQIHHHSSAFFFILRVVKNNVTWITQILMSALYYSCEKAKEESDDDEQFTLDNTTELSSAVHHLSCVALRNNHADLTLELLKAFKILSSFDSSDDVGGYQCEIVNSLVMEACFNCCDGRVIKELRSCFFDDWLIPVFFQRDAEGHTALEVACSMHSTAPNAVEFFTEMLTFDEDTLILIVDDRLIIDSLSAALTTVCECTDQPELVELFDRKLRGFFEDKDNAALSSLWKGRSGSYGVGPGPRREFPMSAAAANCHHRILLTVMSCIRHLSNSRIFDGCLALELYKKTSSGYTPFLTAVANGLMKNVKILIAQSESKEEYQEKWLNRMVDMKGQNAIALCGDANEELKDFLLQEDCWEVSRRFYAQEMEKLSEMKKESGARRQREEGNAV